MLPVERGKRLAGAFDRVSLAGRVITITGATGGIGSAAARLCAARGASVVIADLDDRAGNDLVAEIRDAGGEAIFLRVDVTRESDVAAMVEATVSTFGKLDGAFNNAGIGDDNGLLADLATPSWQKHLDVNLTGLFLCMKYQIPRMLAQGRGAILNTASTAGIAGIATAAHYVASKHGAVGVSRAAALDYATQGIRVNALLPGSTETPMVRQAFERSSELKELIIRGHPIGRLAEPSEIAETAAWLLSDAASFITGAAITVDGGYTTW